MCRIVVVGSINMDLVTQAPRFVGPGETILGERFLTMPGGKGANQAVAAARLGAEVALVGALGDDAFGQQLRAGLATEGVHLDHVARLADSASGTASITVAGGENQIIVVPGANARVTPAQVDNAHALIERADAVLVQMEIPLDTVEATVRLGHRLGVPVILNPAPAQKLPTDWLKLTRYVTPNQHELAILLGADPDEDFRTLMQRAPCPVVLTRGGEGAWYREQGEPLHQSGFKVHVVDSTGAGDTFNAALAVFLHEGLPTAVRKACAAAALSVTKLGAQGGMPGLQELDAFLAQQAG
ncbi:MULTISPECIES: ribokinase [Rhodanobacter]|uniref:ribokinase n=1 Tax=Rhodanobacter TaxID=75309 RepID=UPI000260E1C9|nr:MULTISPECIES: ribokinase [Rhodanobacter]EIM03122.1 ribokinase [Rhodanobacter denitrificans]KZC21348.1 ribokinase [Rhodanobacter denitrificans]UJJ51109.1 ribokinase [Rhodanobacter denitrificans]UJJ60109.1 ribokinase [Rhodanobacter denitrificans]UJM90322.1 ribokinase [Rhodanobacter denitrificans]